MSTTVMCPTPVRISDGEGRIIGGDAFGRFRISNPVGVFENKNIHDRRRNQWEEPIVGAIITYENLQVGVFEVAETVTGATSGTIGTITAVAGGSVTITYTVNHDDFEVGEEIEGGTSGATADILTVGTGSTVAFDRDTASVTLQVGTSSGDSAVRTTHRYFSYIPGKSQFIGLTFILGETATNVRRRVGYFDPSNGIFLEQTSEGLFFVRRSKTSGSIVDDRIHQNDASLSTDGVSTWNKDRLDGNGESKNKSEINLDFTKEQFLFMDFQWQGAGRIRYGFEYNGKKLDAHHINTSNTLDVPWMSTPSLPIRYEISNTGATSTTHTMKEVCTAIVSEGGERLTGVGFSVSTDITARALTAEVPILAIRLKSSFGGGENRRTVEFSSAGIFATTNAAHFEIRHIHDPSGITANWVSVAGGSAVEFSTDITTVVGNPAHKIEEGYIDAGQAGKGGAENTAFIDKADQHRLATQNIDSTNSEMFVIFATALTGTSNVYSHMSWVEFD